MINKEIIRIASNTKNVGLQNIYTHKITVKNQQCGDKITLELITNKSKIKSMRYETESCIYCEASASFLSKKIKDSKINDIKKEILTLKSLIHQDSKFPKNLLKFKRLFHSDNLSRFKCIILPFDAVLKVLK